MTVYDNMAFGLRRRKLPKAEIERRVSEAARILGIGDILKRKPGVLSGGQKQRVAVGRAIVREPKAFLFDEPLSNLDARQRLSTRAEIKALHLRLKATSIYVTHDQEEAMTLGDRVVVMHGGTIRQVGPPLEVYRKPVDRFVAGFIGTPPMNFIDGTIAAGPEGLLFEEGSPDSNGRARRLAVSAAHAGRFLAHVGKPVVLGLRPQALRESGGTGGAERVWELPVRVVEPLGDALDVYCLVGKTQVVARVGPGARIEPGGTARLAPDMEQAHYFEPGEFGRALLV
jgi:multiple sugar transport system ATP-binding protein